MGATFGELKKCASCHATVRFVETVNSRPPDKPVFAILNPDPVEGGNVMVGWDGRLRFAQSKFRQCRVCGCTESDACQVEDLLGPRGCAWADRDLCDACSGKPMVRYVVHHATCPDANRFRKDRVRAAVDAAAQRFEEGRAAGRTVSEDIRRHRHPMRR